MVAVNVIAAETDAEAQYQFSSLQQSFTLLRRGAPGKVPPPIDNIDSFWNPVEKAMDEDILLFSVIGAAETVERGLRKILDMTQADELIVAAHIYDHQARLRSFEIAASVRDRIGSNSKQKSEAISAD
jgi:alkanesulfonate monooxygenase SsuD/methylene tetrahydromethanopterin reductase-like flavin-dependent oxidoreductase (luciferase family)